MDEILKALQTPYFWFAVVFMDIALTILKKYGGKFLGNIWSKFRGYKISNPKAEEEHKKNVQYLIDNPDDIIYEKLREIKMRVNSAPLIVIALIFMAIGDLVIKELIFTILLYVIGILFFKIWLDDTQKSMEISREVFDARLAIKKSKDADKVVTYEPIAEATPQT